MAKVKSVYQTGYEDVYNMEVENHHNYSVNGGFILHNCDSIRAFCVARMITSKQPQAPQHYNFDFEKPQDTRFGEYTEDFFDYRG